MDRPTCRKLAALCGISVGAACDFMNGTRQPSDALAIHVFRCSGVKHDRLDGLTDEQIDFLEQRHPYFPRKKRAA